MQYDKNKDFDIYDFGMMFTIMIDVQWNNMFMFFVFDAMSRFNVKVIANATDSRQQPMNRFRIYVLFKQGLC